MTHNFIEFLLGKKCLQPLYQKLHTLSLYGMNYGNGGDFHKSGELYAAQYIKNKLASKSEKLVIFDVGANIGHYSIDLVPVFGSSSVDIHAFEPSKTTFEPLKANVCKYDCITPHNLGLSDKQQQLTLHTSSTRSSAASVYNRNMDNTQIVLDVEETIDLSTVDLFCQQKGIDHIHFLKIDVEGHELSVLQGAANMIKEKKISYIQFEFGGTDIDARVFFRDFWYLLRDNYTFHRIVKNGLQPIKKYKESLEIFSAINYLLEIRP